MERFVPVTVAGLLLVLAALGAACPARPAAAQVQPHSPQQHLDIRVDEEGWGTARADDIELVLHAAAAELIAYFPGKRLAPIEVRHTDRAPMVEYERGSGGEYRVALTAVNTRWSQYAYEFAHELCHILSNFEHHPYSNTLTHQQWFEESLCEVASLYTLKRLAVSWELAPPRPEWESYAPAFQRYAEHYLGEEHRRLPSSMTLAAWFEVNRGLLESSPYLRGHNEVIANVLLPLFEENPDIWQAIAYLNVGVKGRTFREYLLSWHDNAPEEYRDLILYTMGLFGLTGGVQPR